MSAFRHLFVLLFALLLAACGSAPRVASPVSATRTTATVQPQPQSLPALPKAGSGRGAYYKDDGPGENPPADLELILDAEPKVEPYARSGNKPYVVFGKTYTPMLDDTPFSQRGTGSWYGKKFHGQKTSSGELYDMYKMTAAHPTLPIPSYARITNISNGRQVIVKINDRGPFHSSRIVDLSYTAALKLDYLSKGSSELLLERLLPADIEKMAENKKHHSSETVAIRPVPAPVASPVPVSIPADTAAFESLVAANAVANVTAAAITAPAMTTASDSVSGVYLQFGAFGLRANAEATLSRLQTTLNQLPAFEIVQQGTLYRLFSGPFNSREDATSAIQAAVSSGVTKPVIVQR